MGRFRSMETRGALSRAQQENLSAFCTAVSDALAELVRQLSPTVTPRDIAELPLLTIGSQFQGGNNNTLGKKVIDEVFLAIGEIVAAYTTARDTRRITVHTPPGRTFKITVAADPDVRIEEVSDGEVVPKVAIEVKGGTDRSNAHNRAGEAEKSHQKAKALGFMNLWTINTQKGLDMTRIRMESPTTTAWFDTAQVLARTGADWSDFERRINTLLGLTIQDTPAGESNQ